MIENLEQLAGTLEGMDPGQRLDLPPHVTFRTFWPRPSIIQKDDYLSDRQRAEKWCEHFGCTITETFDPAGLRICKERLTQPEFRGFMPAPAPIDEQSREDAMAFYPGEPAMSTWMDDLIDAVVGNCDTANLDRDAAKRDIYIALRGKAGKRLTARNTKTGELISVSIERIRPT